MLASDIAFSVSKKSSGAAAQKTASSPAFKPESSPATNPPASPNIAAQSTWRPPVAIDPRASIANQLAAGDAAAQTNANIKQLDKAGVSRSKANYSAANLAGAQARGEAQNQAAQTQLNADKTNAAQMLDYQYGSEMEGQKLAMIQQALGQSDWSVEMARQMAAAKIDAANKSGQLEIRNAWV